MNNNLIIKNASQLVTCSGFRAKQGKEMSDLHIVENGALIIEDGLIKSVGESSLILDNLDTTGFDVIDAGGKAVLPGFVDPHTHFVFGGYREEEFSWRLRGDSYMDIMNRGGGILSTVRATKAAAKESLVSTGLARLDSMASFGVTTVEGKSGYGLDHDTEIKQLEAMKEIDEKHPLDVVKTFLGPHAVPGEYKGKEEIFIDYLINDVMPEVLERDLAEFSDIFCEENVFSIEHSRYFLNRAKDMGFKLKFHADEIVQIGGAELAVELGALSADHLLQASDMGIRSMAKVGVIPTLLPGTAFGLKGSYARARYMIDNNCAVALATDMNPGSCFTESIPLIIALAALHMNMTTEEIITSLTINSAAAIDRADIIGSIDVGKKGDIIILEFPSYQYLPYHIGVSIVERVIKGGKVIYDKRKGGISNCLLT